MNKPFCLLLVSLATSHAFASDNQLFQSFDNQINLGLSYQSAYAYNPDYSGPNVTTTSGNLNLGLEQLFNNNLWLQANGSFAFRANQTAPGGVGFSQNTQTFGFPASINGKLGYSFNWSNLGFQVIPYAAIGRQLNYNGMTISQVGFSNSYLNSFAGGLRLEYVFTPLTSLYLDQMAAYLQDPIASDSNQSAASYTTRLGLRYNVTDYFQIAAEGMFNQTNLLYPSLGYNPVTLTYQNTEQTSYGAMLSFAYLFDHDQHFTAIDPASPLASNDRLAEFDNSYSFGMGYQQASNSYSGGSAGNISSSINYFNFNIGHLFSNQVWANLNAQLINSINQSNLPVSRTNLLVPTYAGFPGNLQMAAGYGFRFGSDNFQLIPYANAGLIMNINSYTVKNNSSLTSAIASSRYYQYGGGVRAEYAFSKLLAVYGDWLLAGLNDQSALNSNAWRSTEAVGLKIDPGSSWQIGLKGFYDSINPTGNTYSSATNTYYALQQNSWGGELNIGLRY